MKPDRFLCVSIYGALLANSMKPLVSLIRTVIKSESVFTEED